MLGTGLDPARLAATASKTVVYANSTTRASEREPVVRFGDQCFGGNTVVVRYPLYTPYRPFRNLPIITIHPPMKTPRSLLLLLATLAPAILIGATGCSKSTNTAASNALQDSKDAAKDAAIDVKNAAVEGWDSLKDYTYDKRVEFSDSMDRTDKKMDDKIAEEKAEAPGTLSADKQAAIKDYDDARADLKARLTELGNATADTWADAKAKVAAAWQRVKADYDKATS